MKIREKCAEKKLLKVYFQWNCSAWCCNTIISASSCSLAPRGGSRLDFTLYTVHRSHLLLAITINDRQLKRKHPCQHQLSVHILQNWGKSREISSLYFMNFMLGGWWYVAVRTQHVGCEGELCLKICKWLLINPIIMMSPHAAHLAALSPFSDQHYANCLWQQSIAFLVRNELM